MLGFVHQGGERPELVGDLTPLDLRAVGVLLGEGGGDEGCRIAELCQVEGSVRSPLSAQPIDAQDHGTLDRFTHAALGH